MFNWVENRRLPKGLKYWVYLFQVYKLNWENIQLENMFDIVFEKTKSRGGTAVNKTSVYAEATARGVLCKMSYEKFRRIYKKTSVSESFFW